MSRITKFSARTIVISAIVFLSSIAYAANYNGIWLDNGSGLKRIGDLKVADDSIAIKNVVTYTVTLDSEDGDANIYKAHKANTSTDPLGCGPDSRVNYIIIHTLPAITGMEENAIRLIFYGRSTPPKMKEINNDPGVCAVYSFSRNPE